MSNTLESVKQSCLNKLSAALEGNEPKVAGDLANVFATLEYASRPSQTYNNPQPILETVSAKTEKQVVAIEGNV